MSDAAESPEGQVAALRRFFLLRYTEEVRRAYPAFHGAFPLAGCSRLDLVYVNGGVRLHFVYGRGERPEHLVLVHFIDIEGGPTPEEERAVVLRALGVADPMAHFVLEPPFEQGFDRVEAEAVAAVRRHARIRPRH